MLTSAHPRTRAAGLLLAATVLVAPAAAVAKPKPPDGGATHGTTSCSILTPGVAPGVITTVGRYTVTPKGNGTLVCHGQVPQGPPRAIVVKGLRCPTPAGVTNRSHTVITPSGRVTLTCHYKAKDVSRRGG
jgi:hypothetical protein